MVDVLEKSDTGWWLVAVETTQGWAPASYLEPMDQEKELDEPEPCYEGLYISTLR